MQEVQQNKYRLSFFSVLGCIHKSFYLTLFVLLLKQLAIFLKKQTNGLDIDLLKIEEDVTYRIGGMSPQLGKDAYTT